MLPPTATPPSPVSSKEYVGAVVTSHISIFEFIYYERRKEKRAEPGAFIPPTVLSTRADGHHDPVEQAVTDVVTEVDVVEDGVGRGPLRLLLDKDVVLGVGGLGEGVCAVGTRGLDVADQGLVPEELPYVRDRAAGQGAVVELGGILMEDDVL